LYGNATSGAFGGFSSSTGGSIRLLRCISHDNNGTGAVGFSVANGTFLTGCVADTNNADGLIVVGATAQVCIEGFEANNNGGDGIELANTAVSNILIENCNLIKNGGSGINGSGSGERVGLVANCGFGSGTQANTSGTTTGLKSMVESGSVNYPADKTPWVDPTNGDFRINLNEAINTGRGSYTQTQGGYAGTVGYPVIGAAQVAKVAPQVGMTGGMRG